jgi:hypothetical protein
MPIQHKTPLQSVRHTLLHVLEKTRLHQIDEDLMMMTVLNVCQWLQCSLEWWELILNSGNSAESTVMRVLHSDRKSLCMHMFGLFTIFKMNQMLLRLNLPYQRSLSVGRLKDPDDFTDM